MASLNESARAVREGGIPFAWDDEKGFCSGAGWRGLKARQEGEGLFNKNYSKLECILTESGKNPPGRLL